MGWRGLWAWHSCWRCRSCCCCIASASRLGGRQAAQTCASGYHLRQRLPCCCCRGFGGSGRGLHLLRDGRNCSGVLPLPLGAWLALLLLLLKQEQLIHQLIGCRHRAMRLLLCCCRLLPPLLLVWRAICGRRLLPLLLRWLPPLSCLLPLL